MDPQGFAAKWSVGLFTWQGERQRTILQQQARRRRTEEPTADRREHNRPWDDFRKSAVERAGLVQPAQPAHHPDLRPPHSEIRRHGEFLALHFDQRRLVLHTGERALALEL